MMNVQSATLYHYLTAALIKMGMTWMFILNFRKFLVSHKWQAFTLEQASLHGFTPLLYGFHTFLYGFHTLLHASDRTACGHHNKKIGNDNTYVIIPYFSIYLSSNKGWHHQTLLPRLGIALLGHLLFGRLHVFNFCASATCSFIHPSIIKLTLI